VGTNTRTNVSGSATVGIGQTSMQLPGDQGYSVRAIFAGTGKQMSLNPITGSTAGTDSFTAGTAQVETATIVSAGGATSNGNLALVVTAAGLTGSPLTVNVALTTTAHTTAALIAAACRETLAANTTVAALFTVGGSSAAITLTRKPTSTYTVPGGTLNLYAANDATLNILIPTALGVTGASTSTNTTAGVASAGVKLYDHEVNFEGNPIVEMEDIFGFLVRGLSGIAFFSDSAELAGYIKAGQISETASNTDGLNIGTVVFESNFIESSDITITVIGQTA